MNSQGEAWGRHCFCETPRRDVVDSQPEAWSAGNAVLRSAGPADEKRSGGTQYDPLITSVSPSRIGFGRVKGDRSDRKPVFITMSPSV